MDIILASSSPRRKELMKLIFDEFIIRPSEIEEDIPSAINYELAAEYLASKKANSVVKKSNELVIGCDTVVTAGNIILGKPHDCKEENASAAFWQNSQCLYRSINNFQWKRILLY